MRNSANLTKHYSINKFAKLKNGLVGRSFFMLLNFSVAVSAVILAVHLFKVVDNFLLGASDARRVFTLKFIRNKGGV